MWVVDFHVDKHLGKNGDPSYGDKSGLKVDFSPSFVHRENGRFSGS